MRRRKRSVVARLRPFRIAMAFAGSAIVAAAVFLALWPGFWPHNVVVIGNRRVSTAEILAAARIAPHLSIWTQNTRVITRRIEAIPYIGTASIQRIPPASIRVNVSERAPFALVSSGSVRVLVDRSLRVLAPAEGDEMPLVFVLRPGTSLAAGAFVTSEPATEMRSAYDGMRQQGLEPVRLALDRFGGLEVTLSNGIRILAGPATDLEKKIRLVTAILAQVGDERRRIAAVDVRAPATPVLVYR
ncbi:MAG: FtsQ-type POTRA domain-containing protein [Candidatus Eremiobacteraeota bacterium]|nr:FtsQ-type POTRA domain-containing protein [Candidatus Eremiobacteraeota bacterium]MBV9264019.1 FtsQ-type POTRA domain-containing protein [Candidatus Eremiobacteraeota bacterium]